MDHLLFTFLLDLGLVGIALLCLGEKLLPVVPSYVLLVSFGLTVVQDIAGLRLDAGIGAGCDRLVRAWPDHRA
ncbi:hypothetical protein [Bradyrhizobium brasilense]|uniref:Uncharacterized protein n=1 Tax=Bradyrhizobium brasilense TaxID=1419277 RepID=A0A1G6T9W1_9BRAD|nr:hypothetical protein [Bradyrhizobium brasilense]MCC8970011.1 hypothetical protein [Bradyrhizobium brasilense]SDD25809.1 hypothetical protein SAMN05216337_100984 [Bradyrhizobium brasilense]